MAEQIKERLEIIPDRAVAAGADPADLPVITPLADKRHRNG